MATVADDRMQNKAIVFRGFVRAAEREGLLAQVRDRVSVETRALIDEPPPASSWMHAGPTEEINAAVMAIGGPDRCRQMAYIATRDSIVPLLRLAIESFLRLFGTRPSTILSRMQTLTQSSTRGIEYLYVARTDRSGTMTVTYLYRQDTPVETYWAVAGSLEVVFELCGVRGVVGAPEPIVAPPNNSARIPLHW